MLQRRIILQVSPTINVQICYNRSPAGTSDFQLCICFHSKIPKLQLIFSPAQSSNRYTFHLPYNFFLFLCSSLGTCSDLFSSQEWVGFFPCSVLLFAFLFAFSPPFHVSALFHFFSLVAFRTPATFVHSHHFKLLSHMLPFAEHLPSTDFQSTDACSLSVMATTALKETYRFPSCNSCTNAWHVLPGESLSTLNFLAFVESVKKSDKLQLWQLFQITLFAAS